MEENCLCYRDRKILKCHNYPSFKVYMLVICENCIKFIPLLNMGIVWRIVYVLRFQREVREKENV